MFSCLKWARPVVFAALFSGSAFAQNTGLDAAIEGIAPNLKKWVSVCVVTKAEDGSPAFTWHEYGNTADATDFWPASAIKLYTVVAALELLNDRGFPDDATTVTFERRTGDGPAVLDCARAFREMISEVFRRSSNEDYTLLLRLVGIDRLNTGFLIPDRGFPHSALMRGYVLGRPYGYVREEPQRLTLRSSDGRTQTIEHTWSGRSYAQERGIAQFDARTGNLTSARELAECLRRVMFHEHLPVSERYRLTPNQLTFLRHGSDGLCGLETKAAESHPSAWKNGVDAVFPQARFFHKCGEISNYALEVAFVDDSAESGRQFVLVPVVQAGSATKPDSGEKIIGQMARAIGEWVKRQ